MRGTAPRRATATLLTYYERHGDILTVTVFMDDPLYSRRRTWRAPTTRWPRTSDHTSSWTRRPSRSPGVGAGSVSPLLRRRRSRSFRRSISSRIRYRARTREPGRQGGQDVRAREATLGYAETAYREYIDVIRKWRAGTWREEQEAADAGVQRPEGEPRSTSDGHAVAAARRRDERPQSQRSPSRCWSRSVPWSARRRRNRPRLASNHCTSRNVWILVTPDGNLALQSGEERALLIDTGRAGAGEAVPRRLGRSPSSHFATWSTHRLDQ